MASYINPILIAQALQEAAEKGHITIEEARRRFDVFVATQNKTTLVPGGWLETEIKAAREHGHVPMDDPHPKTIEECWERALETIENARKPDKKNHGFHHPLIGECAVVWERYSDPLYVNQTETCIVVSRPWQSKYARLCRVYKADTTLGMICHLRNDSGYTIERDNRIAERAFPPYTSSAVSWDYR